MDCCPMCGEKGFELRSTTVVKDGKLMDRIMYSCDHLIGRVAWVRHLPLTPYTDDLEMRHGGRRVKGLVRSRKEL